MDGWIKPVGATVEALVYTCRAVYCPRVERGAVGAVGWVRVAACHGIGIWREKGEVEDWRWAGRGGRVRDERRGAACQGGPAARARRARSECGGLPATRRSAGPGARQTSDVARSLLQLIERSVPREFTRDMSLR